MMDSVLSKLCDDLKTLFALLKPRNTPFSFVLLTGRMHQGKSELLQQSPLTQYPIDNDYGARCFYNNDGIILELGETWLNQSQHLLAFTLKQLNRCYPGVKISGIILCVDSSELLHTEPVQLHEFCKAPIQLAERFGYALGYSVDLAIFLTKVDSLAGFCEFFQSDHSYDLSQPLGFSLTCIKPKNKLIENYQIQFEKMIEALGQQIIKKLHPARSSLKRTLIREFPLQLASLRVPIQGLIQHLSLSFLKLQAVYFLSARQGGISVDKLNKKIQSEYALTIQDTFLQANNFRAYFIEGAIKAVQEQTKRYQPAMSLLQKMISLVTGAVVSLILVCVSYQYFHTTSLLDEASKELLLYESLNGQTKDNASALYHLTKAESKIESIPKGIFLHPRIQQLKSILQNNSNQQLRSHFLPGLLAALESIMTDPMQTQLVRYQALKIYLMLGESQYFSDNDVIDWFGQYWQKTQLTKLSNKQLFLLHNVLKKPFTPVAINRQVVTDVRNYLNALPAIYLYYSLAKNNFPKEKTIIKADGFDSPSKELPIYFTKAGFGIVLQALQDIAHTLQQENWVLARQDLNNLQAQLQEAYCFDYANWWQNFIRHTKPQHFQNYLQARQLAQTLHKSNAIAQLIHFIQQQTAPDVTTESSLFNQHIANQFTSLNLMTDSTIQELSQNINELDKFLTTLSLIKDQGETVFNLTKARFQNDSTDPLSTLYNKAHQLPEAVSAWAKQIADDTWFMFINDSRDYLNKQWERLVYHRYEASIAYRYPLEQASTEEVALTDFEQFFAPQGTLGNFVNHYLKSFLDRSNPQWKPKELNGYVLPISTMLIDELIRANVISNMFFMDNKSNSEIEFSLQKINLDPMVANFQLTIGATTLTDNQASESETVFQWPSSDAKLILNSIDGNHYELNETGPWAFFKMLQKVNVLVDSNDSASLQILFEVNGNSGRYLLRTQNQINPFSPGILTGFHLTKTIA